MLARIRRAGRMWGGIVLRSPGCEFHWGARKAFSSIASVATELIERINDRRIHDVRARIDHNILEQIGPKDLFYQILHGIRSLVGYDHSAALLTCEDQSGSLNIVGEQIAWRKSKSQKVGQSIPLDRNCLQLLRKNQVFGFNRDGRRWHDWTESDAACIAELLDYNEDDARVRAGVAEGAMIVAPLVTRHELLGVLKVAAIHPGTFGTYAASIISQFLLHVAVALQNMRRTESLELRMRAAERKQAMADLARGPLHVRAARYARISCTTRPCTSVRRKSRPA